MMRLALGGKWGKDFRPPSPFRGSSAAPVDSAPSSVASTDEPRPTAVRPKKWRRVRARRCSRSGSIRSFLGDRLVEVQQHAGHRGIGGELGVIERPVERRLADPKEFLGRGAVRAELREHIPEVTCEDFELRRPWFADQCQSETVSDATTLV